MSKRGVIYILTNPSFPDYVKIGYASNLQNRLKQLNKSETIPFAFRVYAIYETDNNLTDKELHKLIDKLNPSLRSIEIFDGKERVKEFYAMSPEDAYSILDSIAKISGTDDRLKRTTPEGHEFINNKNNKLANKIKKTNIRPPFRFSMCNIKPGEEVIFVDDDSKKAFVIDDQHVKYNNKIYSLSALAKCLKELNCPLQGPRYFKYKANY